VGSFLNIGPWEITVIIIIAILMIGPKRAVEIARLIGRVTAQMRKLSGEFMGTIQTEIRALNQEAKEAVATASEGEQAPITSLSAELKSIERETRQVVSGIAQDVDGIIKGELASEEEQNG
jgi:Sec-independent protein translocase protein TatA